MISKSTREFELLKYVEERTRDFVDNDLELDTDAYLIAIELKIDRANVSRTLNKLWRQNELIKIQGRPTLYLHRKLLESIFVGTYFPSVLGKDENYQEYVKYSKTYDSSNEIIGVNQYESLSNVYNELDISFSKDSGYKFTLIRGVRHVGKKYLVDKVIYDKAQEEGIKITRLDCYYYYLRNLDRSSFTEAFERTLGKMTTRKIVIIEHCEVLESLYGEFFFGSFVSFYNDLIKNVQVICIYNDESNNTQVNNLAINKVIDVPRFDNRSIIERFKFVLLNIQQEADKREKTISISKATLSCFVTGHYRNQLRGLKMEINHSIDFSIVNSIARNQNIVKIGFEELSDNLLNSITDVDKVHSQVQNVSAALNSDTILFIPFTENQELSKLNTCYINESGFIVGSSLKITSIRDMVYDDLRSSKELTNWHEHFLSFDTRYSQIVSIVETYLVSDSHKTLAYRIYEGITNTNSIIYKSQLEYDDLILNDSTKETARLFVGALEDSLNISLSKPLIHYINTYLNVFFNKSSSKTVTVLVVCHGDRIAEKFAMHINSMQFPTLCQYLNYTDLLQSNKFSEFINILSHYIESIDTGGGVILVTDLPPLSNIDFSNSSNLKSKVLNISPVSVNLLIDIMHSAYELEKTIYEIENMIDNDSFVNTQRDYSTIDEGNISDISSRLLKTSLTFLDSDKATRVLWNVVQEINKDMGFEYDEQIAIRFIVHCAFLIERVIRQESYEYKKTRKIIKEYPNMYHCISRHLVEVNDTFAISIPTQEIARLCEIFLELISVDYNEK